jgi:hypothetical protein
VHDKVGVNILGALTEFVVSIGAMCFDIFLRARIPFALANILQRQKLLPAKNVLPRYEQRFHWNTIERQKQVAIIKLHACITYWHCTLAGAKPFNYNE